MTAHANDRQICQAITALTLTHGYNPSIREVAGYLGHTSVGSMHERLSNLRDKGLVDWLDGKNRTLHVTRREP